MRLDVSVCSPIVSQCVLQSQCQYLLCSSLRGCAKAGESVLVHGASGGVSIPRGKWQRTLLSVPDLPLPGMGVMVIVVSIGWQIKFLFQIL